LALLVAAIWGVNFVVIDIGLQEFPPLLFSALRFLLAALPAVFFVGRPQVPWRWVIAVGVALGIMKFSLLFVGMNIGMPAGLASLVLQGQAVFTMGFAVVLLKERPRGMQVTGMLIAAAGMLLVALESGDGWPIAGFLLVVGAAACWGLSNIAMRKASPPDMFRFMVWVSVVPPVPLVLLSLPLEGAHRDLDALRHMGLSGIAAAVYVAWIATLFGYAAWGHLLRTYDAATVAPFSLFVPVFGIVTAWAYQGERVTLTTVFASALVVVGILVGMLRLPRKRPAAEAAVAAPQLSQNRT
jgi:O-acetylserine/cysteine efflux transporter